MPCYRAWQRSGSTLERFWSKVKIGGPHECWLWTASAVGVHGYKYGQFGIGRGPDGKSRNIYAHRFACELEHGPIPEGMVAMHSCDRTLCCNPSHLSIGTQADNLRDASRKGHFRVPRSTAHKVSTDDLAIVDDLLTAGVLQSHIAARFGVSKTWVSLYARGLRRPYDSPTARDIEQAS